ncbi:hypothetical protein GOBAR_DD17704 [Gossypium barbadense]|nr:hypothetical protein GOBAR_DD17704 [Gossypium barbadense]
MASLLKASSNVLRSEKLPFLSRSKTRQGVVPKKITFRLVPIALSLSTSIGTVEHDLRSNSPDIAIPIMVNGCTGKMGKSVIQAADSAGLYVVPVSFDAEKKSGQTVEACGKKILVHGPSDRESILASVFQEYPSLIVVDYTVPATINDNAELYGKVGVPFVMGTTGGDRDQLYKTVEESKVYAVISPQMGKQVVAFLAAMEIMAEQFPGAFSGYSLQVMESHQAGKLDTSGTAKAIISCFQKLGVSFDMDQIQMLRDPKQQIEMVGVPEEHLSGHAFHLYHLTSPDQTVSFEFQHNVCGRSIYAEGTVDAILFLAKKVKSKADKRIYNMIDVLREASMGSSLLAYFLIPAVFLVQKEDESQLILSRNSYIVLGAIQVTPDVNGGVAFLINDNSSLLDNSQGWWLGMVNANTNGSSQASVAVEFDTRKSDEQDMEGNHIGLNINRIQSTKQVSLSNYDVNISAGGQDLRKIFMGFFGSTSNEAELNCVKSWAFSDTDIGGNGKQLWVWIMVPVASLGILVGVAICLCLRREFLELIPSSILVFSMKQITVTAKRVKDDNSANGSKKIDETKHENDYDTKLSELKGALSSEGGNKDKLAIRFQEGRAAEGDGPVNGLPKVDRGKSVQSDRRTGAKRRKSGSVKRFKQDPASSGPNLTQNATNVHVGYAITDAEMEIVKSWSDGKEVMVDNQYLQANNPLLIIMAKPAGGPARRDK